MERKLPTDEEFLDALFEASPPDTQTNPTEDPAFLSEAVSMLSAGSVFPADIDISQKVKEMFDPRRAFRGWATQVLRDHAVSFLGADEQYLRAVPIGMLFSRELNGYAIKTPRGGAVIVLDKGILVIAGMLARCMLALTSWSSPEPYCRDHTPVDFVAAILCLANFDVTADYRYLNRVKVRDCPSLDPWDLQSVKIRLLIEFVCAFTRIRPYRMRPSSVGRCCGRHFKTSRTRVRGRRIRLSSALQQTRSTRGWKSQWLRFFAFLTSQNT